jgi:hypothetical protein
MLRGRIRKFCAKHNSAGLQTRLGLALEKIRRVMVFTLILIFPKKLEEGNNKVDFMPDVALFLEASQSWISKS